MDPALVVLRSRGPARDDRRPMEVQSDRSAALFLREIRRRLLWLKRHIEGSRETPSRRPPGGARILVLLSLLLASVPAARASVAGASAASQEERNKAVARRVFEEIFNEGRFEVADEIYAPDFVNHGLKRNVDLREDQEAVHQEKAAFPDLRMSVDLMAADGDLVTVVWTFRGTHTRAGYGWLPPTGAKIAMRGITVWRIVDGRIRDEWTSFNQLGAYIQLLNHVKWLVTALVLAVLVLAWGAVRGLRHLWARRGRSEA